MPASASAARFVQGYVGYGWDNHDIDRRGVVEGMSASPDGNHWIAGAKAGYLMGLGAVRVGPVVGLDYARVRVDGYTEDGDPALTLNVGSTRYNSRCAATSAPKFAATSPAAGSSSGPTPRWWSEKELSGGNRVGQLLADLGADHRQQLRLRECVAQGLWPRHGRRLGADLLGHQLDAGISMTAGKNQGNETSGHFGLKAASKPA